MTAAGEPRFGVVLPQGWRGDLEHLAGPVEQFEALVATAQEAERLGFESAWLYDHLQGRPGRTPSATFECWTSLAALARETRTLQLGQTVTCVGYRNPALLAKMASTVDVASGGRVVLGLGAGWDEAEHLAYGYPAPFPSVPERLARLEEAIEVVLAMWTEDDARFKGRFHRVLGARNDPSDAGRRRIPLLVGGAGERVLLRLVARYADACNLTDSTDPGFYRRKLDVLRAHCEQVGRDYESIRRTASFTVFAAATRAELDRQTAPLRGGASPAEFARGSAVGTPAELVETFGALVEAGIQSFLLYFHEPARLETMRLFADEVVPALRA